ncbi:hypothetical protein E2542_SST09395 [Spatholobus suberectus]|nr:hypothetical protein E2542_SST09395 [Spatholobus suberectus]
MLLFLSSGISVSLRFSLCLHLQIINEAAHSCSTESRGALSQWPLSVIESHSDKVLSIDWWKVTVCYQWWSKLKTLHFFIYPCILRRNIYGQEFGGVLHCFNSEFCCSICWASYDFWV